MSSSNTNQMEISDQRIFDVVIFGASGLIGQFLVEELALVVDKHYPTNDKTTTDGSREKFRKCSVPRATPDGGIKWAIAGRSAMKLNECLCKAELSTGIGNLSNVVQILLADLSKHKSLLDMCAKTSLVINCVGPYSLDGEALIKACICSKTNYVDLCHETTFIERMRRKYHKQALEAQVFIINGCGFQAMSAEMGLNFVKRVVDGQIDEVKIVLNLSDTSSNVAGRAGGLISRTMWQSMLTEKDEEVCSRGESCSEIEEKRKQLVRKDTQSLVKDVIKYRNRKSLNWFQLLCWGFDDTIKCYCLPINSLTSEESQLIRGEMTNYDIRRPDVDNKEGWKPIRSTSLISVSGFVQTMLLLMWIMLFNILIQFWPIRSLMKRFPAVFSVGNVVGGTASVENNTNSNNINNKRNAIKELNRDSLSHIKFSQTFLAYGTPGCDSGDPLEQREPHVKRKRTQLLVARIVGPEPNYVTSASYAIQASLALILERDHLPTGGGVLTPGVAFSETNIIYQLRRRNIKFEVLKKA